MDSLLATYASSDEEEENQPIESKSLASSSFSSSSSSSLLFSKLPQPKSQSSNPFSSNPKPKKLVHFHPPKPLLHHDDHDDDHDDDKKEKTKKHDSIPLQAPSVKSFLSTIPAPRNSASLGPGSSSSGTARKSILEANVPALSNSDTIVDHNQLKDENISYNEYPNVSADYTGYDYSVSGEYQYDYGPASVDQGNYYEYGQYEESKWIDRSGGNVEPQIPVARPLGKRGRNEIPAVVIEVNQDELMKNRPRPDQAKLTGIAFGPSYQPTSSTKGKPSKLHKRKHQIGSLYFDMRSKEAELAERRSKGFLTKAETQAKYGW